MFDTGDTVRHTPSGEEWVVAFAQGGRLYWCGWPEGSAAPSDCEMVAKATPARKLELLREMARMDDSDVRGRYARRVIGKPLADRELRDAAIRLCEMRGIDPESEIGHADQSHSALLFRVKARKFAEAEIRRAHEVAEAIRYARGSDS